MTANFLLDDLGYVDAHVEYLIPQSQMIQNTIRDNCPHFIKFQSYIRSGLFAIGKTNNFEIIGNRKHPLIILNRYTYALEEICWHTLFTRVRLDTLASWVSLPGGQDTLASRYISYYFHGLISNSKAIIDILGLIINQLFELDINKEKCGLDRGSITSALSKIPNAHQDKGYIDRLYRGIDRYQNSWIRDFYKFRNIVIHRHEFGSLTMSVNFVDAYGMPTSTHPFSIHFREETEHIEFIRKIAPKSIIANPAIDPILFHIELWEKLVLLIEHVCKECLPQIDILLSKFLSSNQK